MMMIAATSRNRWLMCSTCVAHPSIRWCAAALLGDESVETWDDADNGDDGSDVQKPLVDVQYIQASGSALAALLGDESLKPGAMLTMAMMASTSSNPR